MFMTQIKLFLIQTLGHPITIIPGYAGIKPHAAIAVMITTAQLHPAISVRTIVISEQTAALSGIRRDDINYAVYRIGAIQRRPRPFEYLYPLGHFRMRLEQFVNVTKAGSAQRNTIFCS